MSSKGSLKGPFAVEGPLKVFCSPLKVFWLWRSFRVLPLKVVCLGPSSNGVQGPLKDLYTLPIKCL